jgi:uncharacterized protein (TIGR02001 family)
VSDYIFRGFTQTLGEAAIQGGIDAALPSGLYLGVWGSSIDFGEDDARQVPTAHTEIDVYAGIAPSVGGFDLDLGGIFYGYPGAAKDRKYNFVEAYGSVSRAFGPVSAGVSGAFSPEFFGAIGPAIFTGLDLSATIPDSPIGVSAGVGHQALDEADDYNFWSAGASLDVIGVSIGAGVTGTDIEDDDPRFFISIGM